MLLNMSAGAASPHSRSPANLNLALYLPPLGLKRNWANFSSKKVCKIIQINYQPPDFKNYIIRAVADSSLKPGNLGKERTDKEKHFRGMWPVQWSKWQQMLINSLIPLQYNLCSCNF